MDLSDFDDIDVINEEDTSDLSRFAFVDEVQWRELVNSSLSPSTLKKLKFVENLFDEWKNVRYQVEVS